MAFAAPSALGNSASIFKTVLVKGAQVANFWFYLVTRSATNNSNLYANGVLQKNSLALELTPAIPVSPWCTGARGNAAGTSADLFYSGDEKLAFIATSMTATDDTNLFSLFGAYQNTVIAGGRATN